MTLLARTIVPVRSLIAILLSRIAPRQYKQIIERRHPGVQVRGDANNDVRILKDQSLEYALRALEGANLDPLARIDDRTCWIILVSSGNGLDGPERLALKFLEYGLRVHITMQGRRTKRLTRIAQLEKWKQGGPLNIIAIRTGMVWMRARGYRQIGWHSSVRIHFYDWDERKGTYCARNAGSLPPMIDKQPTDRDATVTGLSHSLTRLDKIRFPIDVVYTWVDGNDVRWNAKRMARAGEIGRDLHKVANSKTRYMNRDELRYSLRSLYYYAPWVRNIFIVTDDQVPNWYEPNSSMLTIVSHRELFPDSSTLPTFNSHAIESVLHRIPGLSEHFIYMNDDVFFSSVVHPEAFFEVNGIARTFLSKAMIPFCNERRSDVASEWGAINANRLLYQVCGAMMPYKTKHTPIPLRKTLLAKLEGTFHEQYYQLRRAPFRTSDDLAPTSSLHAYFGMSEGFVVRGDIAYRYLNLARPDLKRALESIAYSSHSMVYCLNDTEVDERINFDWDQQEQTVTGFLRMMYPYQAPWEKTEQPPEHLVAVSQSESAPCGNTGSGSVRISSDAISDRYIS